MSRSNVPPFTKAVLGLFITLSTVVAFLRYSTYIVLVSQSLKKQELDSSIQPDSGPLSPRPSDLYVPYLTVVPGQSIIYPWVLITAALVEENLISFIVTGSTLYYCGRYYEHLWGSLELLKFLLLQAFLPNLLVLLVYVGSYAITGEYKHTTICGGVGIICGFLVAFKQLVPEHDIVLFRGLVRIKVKQLPGMFLLFNTIISMIGPELNGLLAWAGFFSSWIYLRFFRITFVDPVLPFSQQLSQSMAVPTPNSSASSGLKIRGDASESFALARFFPGPIALIVQTISNSIFPILVSLRICEDFAQNDIDQSNMRIASRLSPQGNQSVLLGFNPQQHQFYDSRLPRTDLYPPGSARAEADRKRSIALRALDQRLNQKRPENAKPRAHQPLAVPEPVVLPRQAV